MERDRFDEAARAIVNEASEFGRMVALHLLSRGKDAPGAAEDETGYHEAAKRLATTIADGLRSAAQR